MSNAELTVKSSKLTDDDEGEDWADCLKPTWRSLERLLYLVSPWFFSGRPQGLVSVIRPIGTPACSPSIA